MSRIWIALVLFGCAGSALADDASARPEPPVLKQTTSEFPKGDVLEARILTATLAPGTKSPWHTHAAPVGVYVMEGSFTLEIDGGKSVVKNAGEALLEPINVKVRAANNGAVATKVVIFQVSNPAEPFLVPTK